MPSRRSLLKALVTLGALAVLLVPAVVVFGLGWIRVQSPEAYPRQEQTPIEAWAALPSSTSSGSASCWPA